MNLHSLITQFYNLQFMLTNNRSLLQSVVRVFMEQTAGNDVAINVTKPSDVTKLQESATEDVNQDGQG